MDEWQKWFICGWSHVDWRRWAHHQVEDGTKSGDISFLCPNKFHLDFLTKNLAKEGSGTFKVSKGNDFGGHAIVMYTVNTSSEMAVLLRLSFAMGLKLGGLPFLRGYLEHQVSLKPKGIEAKFDRFLSGRRSRPHLPSSAEQQ